MIRALIAMALVLMTSVAFASPRATDLELIERLAMQPFAEVIGDRCEVRGAVWMNGPKADVNIELVNSAGQRFQGKTGASGIYAISVPYEGTPLLFVERISDPIYVRNDAAKTAHIFQPTIACDHKSQPNA